MTPLRPIENLFAVEVPVDAKDFGCTHVFHGEDVIYYTQRNGWTVPIATAPCHCDLVEFLFTTSGATEQQAAGVVEQQRGGGKFKDYECVGSYAQNGVYLIYTAIVSLQSLLRSNGLDASKNFLLLKRTQ